jgi:hypothetical protein
MLKYFRTILITTICLAGSLKGLANGLCVGNAQLLRDGSTYFVSFDLSWENSWNSRAINSNDGAWVFVKYRLDDGDWKPIYFERTGHTATEQTLGASQTGLELGLSIVDGLAEVVGVFIYPKTTNEFHGSVVFENVRLAFNPEKHGMIEENVVSIRVFGIEMVYVPTGAFDLGDNATRDRFLKHDSVLYLSVNNTFNFFRGIDDTLNFPSSMNTLFPITDPAENLSGMFVPGIGTVTASHLSGEQASFGPWAPFGKTATGNNIEDTNYWTAATLGGWHWIEFQFEPGIRKRGEYFVLKSRMANLVVPRGFYVTGSNDGVNYTLIGGYRDHSNMGLNVMGNAPNNFGVYVPFRLIRPGLFNRYRFYFHADATAISFIGLYDDDPAVNKINSESQLYYLNRNNIIPEEFPKGFQSFWVMKYELTQSAWVDFLNTLTFDQQRNRTGVAPNSAVNTRIGTGRNLIRIRSVDPRTGRATYGLSSDGAANNWDPSNNGGDLPMFNMSWADGVAYADWAGLRPLTELEFEKMSRGTVQAVPNEFVWGSSLISPISLDLGLENLNRPNERQATARNIPIGNVRVSPNGTTTHAFWPMRVGAFATNVSSRLEAGASFYGIMNLNDNVAERYVNVSTREGRNFTGLHGDGKLDGQGFANVENWPGVNSRGTGYRGFHNNVIVSVSNRQFAEVENAGRNAWDGFRGGRTSIK